MICHFFWFKFRGLLKTSWTCCSNTLFWLLRKLLPSLNHIGQHYFTHCSINTIFISATYQFGSFIYLNLIYISCHLQISVLAIFKMYCSFSDFVLFFVTSFIEPLTVKSLPFVGFWNVCAFLCLLNAQTFQFFKFSNLFQ